MLNLKEIHIAYQNYQDCLDGGDIENSFEYKQELQVYIALMIGLCFQQLNH